MRPRYNLFEKAVAKHDKVLSIKVYRSRTGQGLRQAKFAMDDTYPWEDPELTQAEELMLKTSYSSDEQGAIFKNVEKKYMIRLGKRDGHELPEMFLLGVENDGINHEVYFTSIEMAEHYIASQFTSSEGILDFRFEDGKFKHTFKGEDWVWTVPSNIDIYDGLKPAP